MSFKFGDRVRVLKNEVDSPTGVCYLQAGEVGEVAYISQKTNRVQIQSDNPSYKDGIWHTDASNLELVNTTTLQDSYYQQTHPTDFTMPSVDPDKMDTYTMEYFADTPNAKAACSHKWAAYTGIREQFEFCTICDEKRY